ncbi:MAG: Rab family GTPase [Thermodesulfobacteriota bacterium]|nr:Rab family GTPase [Thermodesulfobacteriota bacterium]
MIKKKICMLGAFAVGKTSLVQQYVYSIFSEKYHTTVGVKVDKKEISLSGGDIGLILWDLHGEDEFQEVRMSYLRGASGCLYVIDGTRRATLDVALDLRRRAEEAIGVVPFILAFNKWDLSQEWEIDQNTVDGLAEEGALVMRTSAKTGQQVEEAFRSLAEMMMEG